jgi:hypothetical protein
MRDFIGATFSDHKPIASLTNRRRDVNITVHHAWSCTRAADEYPGGGVVGLPTLLLAQLQGGRYPVRRPLAARGSGLAEAALQRSDVKKLAPIELQRPR